MGTCVRRVVVAACAVACMLIWAAAPGSAVTTYYCDFENGLGHNAEAVGSSVLGLLFTTQSGGDLYFADINSGWYSVTSDDGPPPTQYEDGEYFVKGNVAAYVTDLADNAKISFAVGLGSKFTVGYSSQFEFFLKAYDSSGTLLDSITGAGNTRSHDGTGLSYLTLERPSYDIAYVEAGSENAGGYWMIDDISWVPEPGSIVALALGLAGFVILRRKR